VVVWLVALIVVGGALALGAWQGQQKASPPAEAWTPTPTAAPPLGLQTDTYSCGGLTYAPYAQASETLAAEASGPADALRAAVSRLPAILPAEGWVVAGEVDGAVFYVAPNDLTPAPYAFVEVAAGGSAWSAVAYGDCEPAVPSATLWPITWRLTGPVDAGSSALNLAFQANLCNAVFVGTTVWYGQSSVTVTFWSRQMGSDSAASCPASTAMAAFTQRLAEPLGNRQVRTGPASSARPADGAPVVSPAVS
jgi:hypothetical protein